MVFSVQKQEREMSTPPAEVSAIVNHFLALVREHGVVAELDGALSVLLTAKPVLIIHGMEPEKNLSLWHRSRQVFRAVWTSPNDFTFGISRPDLWAEVVADMQARAGRDVAA